MFKTTLKCKQYGHQMNSKGFNLFYNLYLKLVQYCGLICIKN